MIAISRIQEKDTARPAPSSWFRLFADVKDGEARGACLLAADLFCLLASYYLLKTAREALILSEGGAEVKSYAAAAQALILLGAVPIYGMVASRVNRSRLINGVLLFFASHLLIFRLVALNGHHVGVAFFLWVGVFNLMIVAQFWAFANDLYTVAIGERLFPLVGVGGSLGALFGAKTAARLMAAHVPPADLFAVAAVGLVICVGLNYFAVQQVGPANERRTLSEHERPLGSESGFRMIFRDRYLRLIAVLVILVNLVNTVGEYLLGRVVTADAARLIASGAAEGLTKSQLIGVFYGNFFSWVNLSSLMIQMFLVSRLFKRLGVAGALFALPLIACGSYGLFAFFPVLNAIRVGKILENSTDYSLQNTARHALFLPTSREAKFKAKQAIDGLCWRLGDLLQAVVVFAGVRLAFGIRQFALINEMFVLLWIVVLVGVYLERQRLAAEERQSRRAA